MCGRFALTSKPELLAAQFDVDVEEFPPRFNIAPTQPILMVAAGPSQAPGSNLPNRRALLVRWGLLPSWAKNPKDVPLLINARGETAAQKAAFRAAMRHRRTLVPATGFYEWRRVDDRSQPYWIRPRKRGLIAFAGLMETWMDSDGSEIDTGAIITTNAVGEIASIHPRAPVVIQPEHFSRWLDCQDFEPREVSDLLQPAEPGFFEAIPVSDKVNKVSNIGPELQERIEPEEGLVEEAGPEQLQLF